jgi:hypothetical protein
MPPAGAIPHYVQRQQRVLDVALDDHEGDQQHRAGHQRDDRG